MGGWALALTAQRNPPRLTGADSTCPHATRQFWLSSNRVRRRLGDGPVCESCDQANWLPSQDGPDRFKSGNQSQKGSIVQVRFAPVPCTEIIASLPGPPA